MVRPAAAWSVELHGAPNKPYYQTICRNIALLASEHSSFTNKHMLLPMLLQLQRCPGRLATTPEVLHCFAHNQA